MNALHLRYAFLVWIFSNAICLIYFAGVWRGWWKVKPSSALELMTMYLFFLGTAIWGWMF